MTARTTILILLFTCVACKVDQSHKAAFESGIASWYGPGFHGKTTASGEKFNTNDYTAAHRTLPFGTRVKVINADNGNAVIVRINDRGPYAKNRIIDLSKAAAKKLDMLESGTANVQLFLMDTSPDNLDIEDIKKPTYTIQIGSFSDQYAALTTAKKYYDGWIDESKVNGKRVFRVYAGKFTSVEEAKKRKSSLAITTGFIKQIEN